MITIQPHPFARQRMKLSTQIWLPRPVEEVFVFFAEVSNLESITPPWLRFRILTPRPIEMSAGTLIDYRLRLHLVPIRWRTEISVWEPPFRFVDRQLHGPYRLWKHTHTFTEQNGGTLVRDEVDYAAPGGPFVERLLVRRDLNQIFEYRHQRLHAILGDCPEQIETRPTQDWTRNGHAATSMPSQ